MVKERKIFHRRVGPNRKLQKIDRRTYDYKKFLQLTKTTQSEELIHEQEYRSPQDNNTPALAFDRSSSTPIASDKEISLWSPEPHLFMKNTKQPITPEQLTHQATKFRSPISDLSIQNPKQATIPEQYMPSTEQSTLSSNEYSILSSEMVKTPETSPKSSPKFRVSPAQKTYIVNKLKRKTKNEGFKKRFCLSLNNNVEDQKTSAYASEDAQNSTAEFSPNTPTPIRKIIRQQKEVEDHCLAVETVRVIGSDKNLANLKHRRIVDINHIIEESRKLEDHECPIDSAKGHLSFQSEKREGLLSILTFKCDFCNEKRKIKTVKDDEINAAAVAAMFSVGKGHEHLEEILTNLKIPTPAYKTFRRMENKIGEAWIDCLNEQILEAGKEERKIALEKNQIRPDGTPFITVIADGGWSHRSYGHRYTAKSGCAVIIGKETKKILYLGVRNKYCSICSIAQKKKNIIPEHTCYKNWEGTSPAMEQDMIVEGFKESEKTHGLVYQKLIADGDSSVIKNIREKVPYGREVQKVECLNHLMKNITKKLYGLQKDLTGIEKTFFSNKKIGKTANYVRRILGYCSEQKVKREEIVEFFKNIGKHSIGDHTECKKKFCNDSGTKETMKLSAAFAIKLEGIMSGLTYYISSIMENDTTNLAEAFMHLVSKFSGGKQVFYSRRASYIWRTYGAGLLFQCGQEWRSNIWRYISGKSPASIIKRVDIKRQNKIKLNSRRRLAMKMHKRTDDESSTSANSDYEAYLAAPLSDDEVERNNEGLAGETEKPFTSTDYGPYCNKPDYAQYFIEERKEAVIKQLTVDENQKAVIEKETIGQSDNKRWHDERLYRLTASNFGAVCKRRSNPGDLVRQILYSGAGYGQAVKWGKENEKTAITQFEKQTGKSVKECGLFVDISRGYLGASPDGIVIGEKAVVEVKCPFSLRDMKLMDAAMYKKSFCCHIVNGQLHLKAEHDYMFQVQGEMAITNMPLCYFIVWTLKDLFVEKIHFDEEIWSKMVDKLEKFYFEEMLIEIIDSRKVRNMPLRNSREEGKGQNKPAKKVAANTILLRNAHLMPPVNLKGNLIYLSNTCAFDCFVSIIVVGIKDNKHYQEALAHLKQQNDVIKLCLNMAKGACEAFINKERAEILLNCKIAQQTGPNTYDCNCNISAVCSVINHGAERIEACTNKACNYMESKSMPYFELQLEEEIHLKNLSNLLETAFQLKTNVLCTKCKSDSKVSYMEPGEHLLLLVDGLKSKFSKNPQHSTFVINDLEETLQVDRRRYTLIGVARFIEGVQSHSIGHYVAYIRRNNGSWEVHNDLLTTVQKKISVNEEINPHLLVYIRDLE